MIVVKLNECSLLASQMYPQEEVLRNMPSWFRLFSGCIHSLFAGEPLVLLELEVKRSEDQADVALVPVVKASAWSEKLNPYKCLHYDRRTYGSFCNAKECSSSVKMNPLNPACETGSALL